MTSVLFNQKFRFFGWLAALGLLLGMVAVMFISPANAASSVVHDPNGDSTSPSPYTDIVHAKVTEQQGKETLFFMMDLADSIPEEPAEPVLFWLFHVDTNPATSPGGLYNEYIVRVRWSGGVFAGDVVDRTPLLTGGLPISTPIPFSIDGRTVKAFVQLEMLGDPSSFGWNAATRPFPLPYLDFAPDGGLATDLATWTE